MVEIKAELVKKLRERSGVGMMECKRALSEASGDMNKAELILRERGLAAASKKSNRVTNQGLIESYIHPGSKIGVLLEVNSETDFVARNEQFKELVHNIALHIAAAAPIYVSSEDVPAAVLESEREIYKKQALNEGKPDAVLEKIAEGRIKKFYQETCLLEQLYVKDNDITINDLVKQSIAKIGENIVVKRFCRFVLGEEIK
ncbi:MAG: translation elongation factor Ts [Actinobacteria bacterium]|nr:translation elongation factor Ts [Actinomycetota bacterium]